MKSQNFVLIFGLKPFSLNLNGARYVCCSGPEYLVHGASEIAAKHKAYIVF